MRTSILAVATCLMVAGCGSNPAPTIDGGTHDLTMTTNNSPDLLVMVTKTGCAGYIQCQNDCGTDTTCTSMCDKNVSTKGQTLFNAAIACVQNYCLGTHDMGSGECILSGNMLLNKDMSMPNQGTPCGDCLDDGLAGLFGFACSNPTGPDCNPASCASTVTACTANTP